MPRFPGPDSSGRRIELQDGPGLEPNSPEFKAAEEACKNLLPNGGRPDPQRLAGDMERALRYAACMRAHGLPTFPDPKASGDTVAIGPIDRGIAKTPQFKAAENACQELLTGDRR